jgi:hypothetical protein
MLQTPDGHRGIELEEQIGWQVWFTRDPWPPEREQA